MSVRDDQEKKIQYLLWEKYFSLVDQQALQADHKDYQQFFSDGYYLGDLGADLVQGFHKLWQELPIIPYACWQGSEHYRLSNQSEEEVAYVNETIQHRQISEVMRWHIAMIAHSIRSDVANRIGTPWRILNTRIWSQTKHDNKSGLMFSNSWHTDGFPLGIYKLMFYFQPLNKNNGSIKLRKEGDVIFFECQYPGSWLLFENSQLFHRGVYPEKDGVERISLELTICKAVAFDLYVPAAGNAAQFPKLPWYPAVQYPITNNF